MRCGGSLRQLGTRVRSEYACGFLLVPAARGEDVYEYISHLTFVSARMIVAANFDLVESLRAHGPRLGFIQMRNQNPEFQARLRGSDPGPVLK